VDRLKAETPYRKGIRHQALKLDRVDTFGKHGLSSGRYGIPFLRLLPCILEDRSVGQPLEVHIRKLQEFYWSEADPDGRGFVPLADALRKAGELQEARRILREGLRRHPEFLAGHVVSAWLSLDEGKLDQAETHYQDALELDPRNVEVLRGLSELHLSRGDEEQAVSYLEALLREDPIDLDLPERLNDLKDRLAAEAASDEAEARSTALAIWDDPDRAAAELNFHQATLQPDESPPAPEAEVLENVEEEDVDEGVDEDEDDEAHVVEEGAADGDPVEPSLDPLVLIVEDGEPLPDQGDLEDSLVTSTLGEIYLRQGLLGRAEWVFESLLEEDPENEHLRKRLDEVQELLAIHGPQRETAMDPPPEPGANGVPPAPAVLDPEDAAVEGWVPEDVQEEAGPNDLIVQDPDREIVPIEFLAPDRTVPVRVEPQTPEQPDPEFEILPVGALAPEELAPDDDLAPDPIPIVDDFAPDEIVSVDVLAPEAIIPAVAPAPEDVISIDVLAPEEFISIEALAPDELISIDALAPEEFISIDALAPDTARPGPDGSSGAVISIDDLAPTDPIPIEALAPDTEEGMASDPTVDDFERWLDKLK
jgi:tetratricopeptide (TPR) repeat protein